MRCIGRPTRGGVPTRTHASKARCPGIPGPGGRPAHAGGAAGPLGPPANYCGTGAAPADRRVGAAICRSNADGGRPSENLEPVEDRVAGCCLSPTPRLALRERLGDGSRRGWLEIRGRALMVGVNALPPLVEALLGPKTSLRGPKLGHLLLDPVGEGVNHQPLYVGAAREASAPVLGKLKLVLGLLALPVPPNRGEVPNTSPSCSLAPWMTGCSFATRHEGTATEAGGVEGAAGAARSGRAHPGRPSRQDGGRRPPRHRCRCAPGGGERAHRRPPRLPAPYDED